MTDQERMQINELMERFSDQLVEHGEAVLILVSNKVDGATYLEYSHRGNYHALLGMMDDFRYVCEKNRPANLILEDSSDEEEQTK